MKPFFQPLRQENLLYNTFGYPCGIQFNEFNLMIDSSIFPRDSSDMEKLYLAMFRYTSFLNTLPLEFIDGNKVLKITGFNNYNTFKIEPVSSIYLNGTQFYSIYTENSGKPSIITK